MFKRFTRVLGLVLFAAGSGLLSSPAAGQGQVGSMFTYQGELRQGGQLLTGTADFIFRLYGSDVGGSPLSHILALDNLAIVDGRFDAYLDFGPEVFTTTNARWLDIQVRSPSGGSGGYTPLMPRQRLTPAPVAIYALSGNASALAPGVYGNAVQFTNSANTFGGSGAGLVGLNASNLGSGTIPSARLGGLYSNALTLNNTANTFAGSGAGLTGLNAGNISSGTLSTARLSSDVPLRSAFNTFSSSNTFNQHTWMTSAGFSEYVTINNRLGVGSSNTHNDALLFVTSLALTPIQAQHSSTLTGSRAILGWATATSGNTRGVYGRADSPGGFAVYGFVPTQGMNPVGVLGEGGVGRYGVYSIGPFAASGSKAFQIDHPDDPENKYLMHYSAESPEVINFYRGTVQLDDAGEALVKLPHYFAKINKGPSYTLTAIGAPMPSLHIAVEISEESLLAGEAAGPADAAPTCWFRIAGGAPRGRVSWRVEAERNDLWMRIAGAEVEADKPEPHKGTYLDPSLYNLGRERALTYDPNPPQLGPVESGEDHGIAAD